MTDLWADARERFMSKVRVGEGPPATGCWEWIAHKNADGYGDFKFKGQMRKAHRVAWEMAEGERIPKGMYVLHSCDNSGCVNPYHLFLGTQRDNMNDMNSKGRGHFVKGEKVAQSKLNESEVLEVRRLAATGLVSYRQLGRMFRVTNQAIHSIVIRRTWRHI